MTRPMLFKSFILAVVILLVTAASAFALAGPGPNLTVSGETLSWSSISGAETYEVKGTQAVTAVKFDYKGVTGTSYTPAPQYESTVTYRVREEQPVLSKWSTGEKIVYGKAPGETQKEKEEREAKEKAEREQKEKEEREQKEREAKELKEKEEREAKEREEKEALNSSLILYQLDTASWFDTYAKSSNAAWVNSHATGYSRNYPTYDSGYISLFSGVKWIGYRDYWTHNSEASESGTGRFPIDTESGRNAYASIISGDLAKGYVGTWTDDVQFYGGHRPSEAESPKWNEGQALLFEKMRVEHPSMYILTNSHWFELVNVIKGGRTLKTIVEKHENASEPYFERALKVIDSEFEEWGVGNKAGVRFHSASSLSEWLYYVDFLHEQGVGMTVGWDYEEGTNLVPLEYDYATLLLVTNGTDAIDGGHEHPNPEEKWLRFYLWNLGAPLGAREHSAGGVWSRHFTHGDSYVVDNGAATATITLPRPEENSKGELVTSITLPANQGAVLRY